ncbi:MAG: helix-turn-helix domain-containing protein, partial [Spirochaetes bacterium]|nr:helix-turn-helix domain-containing protein [Spirochaetota bacterium]
MILYYRRKKNIKQVDMAKALHVSPSYLCKIERGVQ